MPYPPRRPNKYANPEEARAASNRALQPFRYGPGRSGNLSGMSAEQHAKYREIREMKRQLGPAVIERLAELAGLEIAEDGTVTKVPLDEVFRDNDPRVVFAATNSLRDQIFGKPREHDPDEEERRESERFGRLSLEAKVRELRELIDWAASLPDDDADVVEVAQHDGAEKPAGER